MSICYAICLSVAISAIGSQEIPQNQSLPNLEGYTITELKITNSAPLQAQVLRELVFSSKDGDLYDPQNLEDGLKRIRDLYDGLGFIDFSYNPLIDINQEEKTVACSFQFDPGKQFIINKINIIGAKSSKDEAEIQSKVLLKEKRMFSLKLFEHSRRRVEEHLESKGMSLKEFKYEQLTDPPVDIISQTFDTPVYVNIFVLVDSDGH